MSQNKNSERKFGFCLRCLEEPKYPAILIEHHLQGRGENMYDTAFICKKCNEYTENSNGPNEMESKILREKKALLISSSALHFVIKNKENILHSFEIKNKNGPDVAYSPSGISYIGSLAAVGFSGKKYYFLPDEYQDGYIQDVNVDAQNDGVGGARWIVFKGTDKSILKKFKEIHAMHELGVADIKHI